MSSFSPTKELLLREHAWDGLSCSVCDGLLPVPEDLSRTSECIDCGNVSNIGSLEKVVKFVLETEAV